MQESYFTSTCRICFNKDNIMINMLDTTEFDKTVLELSEQCGDVEFDSDDTYEKLICEECANELYLAAKFRQKCQDSKLKYNKIWNAIKQKINGEVLYLENQKYNEQINSLEILNDNAEVDIQELEELQEEDADDEKQEIISVTHFTVVNDILKQEFQTNESIHDELQYEDIEYLDNNTLPDCNNGRPTQYIVIEENITTSEQECYNESFSDTNTIIDENDVDIDIDDNNEEKKNVKNISTDNNISNQIKFNESIDYDWENIDENRIGKRYTGNTSVIINHKCNVCGAGFAKLQNLQRHLTTHVSIVTFGCKYCQEIFTSEKLYKNHEKIHINGSDKIEQCVINKMKIKSKKNNIIKDKKTHKCGFCDKSFISNSMLRTHIRTHTGERPFRCETCCKTFTTQGGLDLHNRRHTGYKPFKCDYCDRAFVESSNLKVHLRIHTGEKPHKCTTCGRSFSRVFLLQIHQRTHTGERPFICPHTSCSKAFAQQGDLAAHKRLHSGERPHKCHICDKGFIKSSGLISHLKRHTKCNAENNAFIDDIIEHDDNFTIIEQD